MKLPALVFFFVAVQALQLCAGQLKKEKVKWNGGTLTIYYNEPSSKVKGLVMLFGGAGEKAQDVFRNTELPKILSEQGYLTIIPAIRNEILPDPRIINALDSLVAHQEKQYQLSGIVLGGFSAGGTLALRYAEHVSAKGTKNIIKGIFVIDSPLDLARLYQSAQNMANNCDGILAKQGRQITNELQEKLGGTPDDAADNYIANSVFFAGKKDGGNAKYLHKTPLLLYSEPDLEFIQQQYCPNFKSGDINAVDLDALSKFLSKAGNTRAEYITTNGRGFHSWNIAEPASTAEWIMGL